MDEHIVVDGEIQHLTGDISDSNLNNLSWWINKHNNYASREAAEILLATTKADKKLLLPETGKQAAKKRWIKETIYSKLPLGLRAFSYFIFRYILRLGFLDGFQGFAFHTLQGLWYRFLVDLKVYEIQKLMRLRGQTLKEVLKTEFGIF